MSWNNPYIYMSFNQETGETSNMTLQVVDNLLNPYFILMDSIDYKN